MNSCDQCDELRFELTFLRQRVRELENHNSALRTHQTLARGIAGERLIVAASGGQATIHSAGYDVILPNGATIEVKSSKITDSGHKWQWNKIFGQNGLKEFDFLIIVGDADHAHLDKYAFPGRQVVFLLEREKVASLCGAWNNGAGKISLTPNPKGARGPAAALYAFQVDPAQLERHLVLR